MNLTQIRNRSGSKTVLLQIGILWVGDKVFDDTYRHLTQNEKVLCTSSVGGDEDGYAGTTALRRLKKQL